MKMNESEQRATFEQMGEEQVRLRLETAAFNVQDKTLAYKWLEEKAKEAKHWAETAQAEQRRADRTR